MKNVYQGWIDNQKEQQRHIGVHLRLFTNNAKPYFCSNSSSITCKELFNGNGYYYLKNSHISYIHGEWVGTQTITITLENTAQSISQTITLSGLGSGTYNLNQVRSFDKITIAGATNTIKYIEFVPSKSLASVVITNKDIFDFNYKAHLSPINEDLPYQKITFAMQGTDYVLTKGSIMLAETSNGGYYAKLGCYYFYLNCWNKDVRANRTTLEFVDVISTMTGRDRYGFGQPTNNYRYHIVFVLDIEAYWNNEDCLRVLPNYQQYCRDYVVEASGSDLTNITNYITNGRCGVVYDNTIAETLQQIAQAIGCVLMSNDDNKVVFNSLLDIDFTPKMEAINTLEKVVESEIERVDKISIDRHILPTTIGQGSQITFTSNKWIEGYDPRYEINYYYQYLDLDDGIYYYPSGSSGYTSLYASSNFFGAKGNSGNTLTINLIKYELPTTTENDIYELSYGNEMAYLDLKLGGSQYSGSVDYAMELLVRYYQHPRRFETNVRFDARFEVGDFFTLEDNEDSYYCLLTDINMVFNGGMTANIGGIIWEKKPKAPIVKSLKYVDANDYYLEIYNPNDEAVNLHIKTTSTEHDYDYTFLLGAGQSFIASNSKDQIDCGAVFSSFAHDDGDYDDEMLAWFTTIEGAYTSDNVIVAEPKHTLLPPKVDLEDAPLGTELIIYVKSQMFNYNLYDEPIVAQLVYDGDIIDEIELDAIYDTATFYLDWDDPILQAHTNNRLTGNLTCNLACESLGEYSEPTTILSPNYQYVASPNPVVVLFTYTPDYHTHANSPFTLKIRNDNDFPVVMTIGCSTYIGTFNISANSKITLTNDGSEFAQEFAMLCVAYDNHSLQDDCYCYFTHDDFTSDNTIIMEAND